MWMNVVQLQGWGNGSILLMFNSYYSTWMAIFSSLLMVGQPQVMMAPKGFRMTLFVLSTLTISSFLGNLFLLTAKYFLGSTPTDSMGEIMNVYLLMLQLAAFVPSVFIFLFDGMAYSPYALFNENYGNWSDVVIPGQQERPDYVNDYTPSSAAL